MTEIFRHYDSATVGLVQSLLESEGIVTLLRNDSTSSSSVAVSDTVPTLCVADDSQEKLAVSFIREHFKEQNDTDGDEKVCASCGEKSPSNFSSCWNCNGELP
ncbi:putative signal transducing protein [Roseibacillus persicicus]|uniref:putative signal transducing protein n=1 Tax=Roseibacillus persicicus TaxID=454148 RepID=UPI001679CE62